MVKKSIANSNRFSLDFILGLLNVALKIISKLRKYGHEVLCNNTVFCVVFCLYVQNTMYSSMVFSNDLDLLEIKFIFCCYLGPEEVKCELPDQLPATKVSPNKATISLVLSRNKIVSLNKLLAISK